MNFMQFLRKIHMVSFLSLETPDLFSDGQQECSLISGTFVNLSSCIDEYSMMSHC